MIYFHFEAPHSDIRSHTSNSRMLYLLSIWEMWSHKDRGIPWLTPGRKSLLMQWQWSLTHMHQEKDKDWYYETFGEAVVKEIGADLTGMRISDLPEAMANYDLAILESCQCHQAPLLSLMRSSMTKQPITWERLMLPFLDKQSKYHIFMDSHTDSNRIDALNSMIELSEDGLLIINPMFDENRKIIDWVLREANSKACKFLGIQKATVGFERLSQIISNFQNSRFFFIFGGVLKPVKVKAGVIFYNLMNRTMS